MKILTKIIIGGFVSLLAAYTTWLLMNKKVSTPTITNPTPSTSIKAPTQIIGEIPIEMLRPLLQKDQDIAKSVSVPSELKGATNDPAVAAFLIKYDPKQQEIGEIRNTPNRTQQLFVDGKLVFESDQILRRRTVAHDGTIVLAAINHSPNETAKQSTIWMIDPSGRKKQVSPPRINASTPLISRDGRRIAFTGVSIGPDGGEELPFVWVFDLKTTQYRKFGPSQKHDNYSVGAAEWSEDGNTLYVLEDYGETGGHMTMKAAKLVMEPPPEERDR